MLLHKLGKRRDFKILLFPLPAGWTPTRTNDTVRVRVCNLALWKFYRICEMRIQKVLHQRLRVLCKIKVTPLRVFSGLTKPTQKTPIIPPPQPRNWNLPLSLSITSAQGSAQKQKWDSPLIVALRRHLSETLLCSPPHSGPGYFWGKQPRLFLKDGIIFNPDTSHSYQSPDWNENLDINEGLLFVRYTKMIRHRII